MDVYLGQGNIGNDGRAPRLWTGQGNSDLPEGNPDICIAPHHRSNPFRRNGLINTSWHNKIPPTSLLLYHSINIGISISSAFIREATIK